MPRRRELAGGTGDDSGGGTQYSWVLNAPQSHKHYPSNPDIRRFSGVLRPYLRVRVFIGLGLAMSIYYVLPKSGGRACVARKRDSPLRADSGFAGKHKEKIMSTTIASLRKAPRSAPVTWRVPYTGPSKQEVLACCGSIRPCVTVLQNPIMIVQDACSTCSGFRSGGEVPGRIRRHHRDREHRSLPSQGDGR